MGKRLNLLKQPPPDSFAPGGRQDRHASNIRALAALIQHRHRADNLIVAQADPNGAFLDRFRTSGPAGVVAAKPAEV